VHPAAGHRGGTLVNALLHRLPSLNVGGHARPGIVHRLDRGTSGCLVVAKSTLALTGLQAQFKERTVDKTYLALVRGAPPSPWRIETLFGRHPVHRKKFTGRLKKGKAAITVCRTVERFSTAALVEVQLLTGRTHQIRVHLAEGGFPILGDPLYGRGKPDPAMEKAGVVLEHQALHAWRLGFDHPRSDKRLRFEAPLPPHFEAALAALKRR